MDIIKEVNKYIVIKESNEDHDLYCCAYHKEKTPSFILRKKQKRFHCFGCGQEGSAYDLWFKVLPITGIAKLLIHKFKYVSHIGNTINVSVDNKSMPMITQRLIDGIGELISKEVGSEIKIMVHDRNQ